MRVVVVGGGKVGYYLVKTLLESRHTVSLVEKDENVARRLAEELGILVINGDGTNQYDLADAGCDEADVLAAVTGKDEENLIVCQVAKKYFNLKRVVARINNPKNERIFSTLGIDVTVSSTSMIAKMIEREVILDKVKTLLRFDRGDISLVEVDLDESSLACEKSVRELGQKLPVDCVLVTVLRKDRAIFPRGDTVLKPGDIVLAITLADQEDELREVLVGRRK
ncbi:MAG: TrkA family potassium uptake protein [Candidatus Fermentithermobacillus carboniphilus]|uniref:Trk system potassium uptake protein TrkA n=1 Tax=Candidatus Fermentithermobacillus carboniphilus TaxID=3085328 RepID=A0AAT9LDS5_9FIRM|nr:MAG: TrkA family potassium uptake protein [Candidatus Fermentithermobacillus carboniphilus]